MSTITLKRFNDLHLHLRQDSVMSVANHSLAYCDHVLVMPNTVPPVVCGKSVEHYRRQLMGAIDPTHGDLRRRLLMTIKLLDGTLPEMIHDAKRQGVVAAKLYPAHVTTHASDGVADLRALSPVFEAMQDYDMVLCLHGELPEHHPWSTVLDWERDFFTQEFEWLVRGFPRLRIVFEHITTQYAVERVTHAREGVAATITPHHLLMTIDDLLAYGLKPTNYCKPVAKTPRDRTALAHAVLSGNSKFFLGSDSAPHVASAKFSDCGCAGCFTAPHLPEIVMQFFHRYGDPQDTATIGRYTTEFGAKFYKLPPTGETFTMTNDRSKWPATAILVGGDTFPVFNPGKLRWHRE